MLILGVGGGVGAGIVMMPEPTPTEDGEDAEADTTQAPDETEGSVAAAEAPTPPEMVTSETVEYLDMSNQFIVPLVTDGVVTGIVVISLSLEVQIGTMESVNRLQPKIRDVFLQVLFNHANNGGFDGNFTQFRYLTSLKEELLRQAIAVAGPAVTDVLVLDLVRQDQ